MASVPFKLDYDMVHSVRRRVPLGTKIKTRCGLEVERTSIDNATLFKSQRTARIKCTYPNARLKPTCVKCCRWLNVPNGRGYVARRRIAHNKSQPETGGNDGA